MAEEIKERINKMVEFYGTRCSFIADKVNLNNCTLSRFMTGKQKLSQDALDRIDKFLTSRGI